jgi:pyruvate dehydrogenase E1 component alpha subunit
LLILKQKMLDGGMLTEEQYQKMDDQVKERCDRAVEFAERSEEPPPGALYEDMYAE